MQRDLAHPLVQSSFLSVEKDTETILKKLFIKCRPYSDILKRLLIINEKDALDNHHNQVYQKALQEASLPWLVKNNFIICKPQIKINEFDEKRSFLVLSFDNFTRNATNPEFRDCIVTIDIISHIDLWELGDYRLRPLKIAGYIDGILDNCRLSGIGTFQFIGCNEIHLNENFSGYTLMYQAVHGSDDEIPVKE